MGQLLGQILPYIHVDIYRNLICDGACCKVTSGIATFGDYNCDFVRYEETDLVH